LQDHQKSKLLRINKVGPDEPTRCAVCQIIRYQLRNKIFGEKTSKGWVRAKVTAVSLNHQDNSTLHGLGKVGLKFPLRLGNEGTGTLEVGAEVIIFLLLGDITLDPDGHVLGELMQGSLAEYVSAGAKNRYQAPQIWCRDCGCYSNCVAHGLSHALRPLWFEERRQNACSRLYRRR
jgi:hypothetical protein